MNAVMYEYIIISTFAFGGEGEGEVIRYDTSYRGGGIRT